jgi:hypothetical protein
MGRHALGGGNRIPGTAVRRSAAAEVGRPGIADVVNLPHARRRRLATSLVRAWNRLRQEAAAGEQPPRSPAPPPCSDSRSAHPAVGAQSPLPIAFPPVRGGGASGWSPSAIGARPGRLRAVGGRDDAA